MKNRIFVFSALVMLISLISCNSTSIQEEDIDNEGLEQVLQRFVKQDSILLYFKYLDSIESAMLERGALDSLYLTNGYYDIVPNNRVDSIHARRYLTIHGQLFKNINDYDEALKFYLKANAMIVDAKSDKLVWNVENRIGSFYARKDDYDKALYYYKYCIPTLENNQDFGKLSRLYKEIGRAYMWLGNEDGMFKYYEEGIKYGLIAKEFKGLQAIHEAYGDFYTNYAEVPDSIKAHHHISHSGIYLDSLPIDEDWLDRKHSLSSLTGQFYERFGNKQKAKQYYQESLNHASCYYQSPKSRELAKIYFKLANIDFENNQLTTSNYFINCGLKKLLPNSLINEIPAQIEIHKENTFVDLMSLKSDYYQYLYLQFSKKSYLDSATMALDIAIKANELLNEKLLLNNSKYISVDVNKQLINKGIDLCYIGYSEGEQKWLQKARFYFDKSKGIISAQNQKKNALRSKMKDNDKMEYASLEYTLIQLLDTDSDSLEILAVGIQEKLNSILRKYDKGDSQNEKIDKPYVEYAKSDKNYYLLTNIGSQNFIKLHEVDSINHKIELVLELLKRKETTLLFGELEILTHWLLPIQGTLPEEIIIIPDGFIHYIPFDMLRINGKFLLENHQFASTFHYQNIKYSNTKKSHKSIFFLNPKYGNPELPTYVSDDRAGYSNLPYAEEEVREIKDVFKGDHITLGIVNHLELQKGLNDSDIFHFAGHALVQNDSSYLLLKDGNGNINKLTDQMITNFSNELDLVTLSACETGLGEYKNGEGVKSLANSFLQSGAKSIAYSLWKADDQSTASIMTSFYKNLADGKPKDEAMRNAKLTFLTTCNPALRHPYYWATFCVAGDTQSLISTSDEWYKIIIVGLVALLVFYLSYSKLKTKQT